MSKLTRHQEVDLAYKNGYRKAIDDVLSYLDWDFTTEYIDITLSTVIKKVQELKRRGNEEINA